MKNWIEISQQRLAHNLAAIRRVAGSDVEVLSVIKADAYGHDAALCAPVLREAGARWLGVTDVEEGIKVREALGEGETRILVMRGGELGDAASLVAFGLTPVIWTADHILAMERAARDTGLPVCVHLEVDTGMSRQGVASAATLRDLLALLAASKWVTCGGVMTHLCCAEVAHARTTASAMERFATILSDVKAAGLHPDFVHIGNTSALDEGTTMPWIREQAHTLGARAMVRTGLATYGYSLAIEGGDSAHLRLLLQPVLTWRARILDIFEIEPGTAVGYGATFTATRSMRLALLAVGYADGYRREASSGVGNGWVMMEGKRALVVGRVSMNLTVVDITEIEGITIGSSATLLGEGVTAEDHARWAGTIPYEILCSIRGIRVLR